jgi:CBS domain-containing protein
MQIREAMCRDVRTVSPTATVREAARLMGDIDAGILPVAEGDRLVGMITDRDIAIRAVAAGKGPDTTVGEAMTHDVKYCFDDQDVEDVCENMATLQVRRMPVVNRDKRLVGIVSLADMATNGESDDVAMAMEGITRPGGMHSQSADARQ